MDMREKYTLLRFTSLEIIFFLYIFQFLFLGPYLFFHKMRGWGYHLV